MQAGKLNTRIVLQRPIEQRDSYGSIVKTWQTVAHLWADVRFQSGREYQRNHADLGVATASVRIRYRRDADNSMRILLPNHNDMVLAVVAVLPDVNGRVYTDLVCKTGENDGR
ncbi:phage head closure protein [Conchiformibius steedae]|uniref:phage head closure protein n=1 Tax=Conchiformibius steedae TaxID=153493 RepID=UPI0026EDB3F1|nr:phage head closure protein [Conchiformibius steedae]